VCQTGHSAVALELFEMTARAAHGTVGTAGALGNLLGRPWLTQVGPRLFREICRKRKHVLPLHRCSDRLHDIALAVAPLEIAQLDVKVALFLPPNDGKRLVDRLAVGAVTAGADLSLFLNALRVRLRYGETPNCSEHHHAKKQPIQLAAHPFIPIRALTEAGP